MKRLLSAALLGLTLSLGAQAAIDTYEFKDEAARERYRTLTEELRCPKCQNQNIADSDAPIAMDLRREIHRMLGEGKSNQEIVDFLVARYGDFVRYNPPVDARTWLLWYGPWLLLGGGLGVLALIVLRRRRPAASGQGADLSAEERTRLDQLLKNASDKSKADQ
ncbi:Cytochrome c-type biogenesis protein CcmH [Pseudomonas sp. OF001]|uniref:cytochrome c-type biogenesis protein n=1 Tax=unclassified Pseudomonas TaxID=196821 RepID=UPI0010A5FC94|nr:MULTISPECIES: cytochrome c-type biogenesis protein [unclassified Pseudomonas]THG87263.1 cytochrome c-type biogenesis protein CcmH [Pseudomonas sp. A-1]CAD5378671.1 Cytochrome c-type biogenesis protein CcmH [Pseudomonas sp. OF001]